MKSNQEWNDEEYDDSLPRRYLNYNRINEPSYQKSKYVSKVTYSSKYIQNSKITPSKNQNNQPKKEILSTDYRTLNITNSNNKDYDYNKFITKNNQSRNSNKYNNHQNKYLSSNSNLNSTLRRYEPTEPNYTPDGVLRGYTNNVSFYISGSSILKPIPTIKNKFNNDKKNNQNYNNYQRINNRTNRSTNVYESKTLNKQSTTPNDFRRRDMLKDSNISFNPKNGNIYSKYSYNINRNKTIDNNINSNENNNIYDKKSYIGYQIPSIQKKILNKFMEKEKKPVDYSKKIYFETEPDNNISKYNKRNTYTENNKEPLIPNKNIRTIEPRATITNIDHNSNNNYKKKIYKTSTNTNLEEKNKSNYYSNIVDKKSNDKIKRNNTPNIIRIEIKHTNKKNNNSIKQNNTLDERTIQQKSLIPIRNNTSNTINHKGYKYKTEVYENDLNKTERIYKPEIKHTLNKENSGSNIIKNKNRYNFPVKTRLREYGTKTEIHVLNNKNSRTILNNKEEEVFEVPLQKNKNIYNYRDNFEKNKKKNEFKKYETSYSHSISTSSRGRRQYGTKTEIIPLNRSRKNYNEYEVTDINSFRKNHKKDYSMSNDKKYPSAIEPINQMKKILNKKKENSTFERSLKNIHENEKEIEKDKTIDNIRGDNRRNHTIFVSNNFSKEKRKYKTSTQKQAFRSHEYTLGDETESDNQYQRNQVYSKIDEDINEYPNIKFKNVNKFNKNININKNNYFNAMKNLEEEIEIEDDQDQVEYIPPKQLFKINQKPTRNEANNNYGYILSQKNKQNKSIDNVGEYKYYQPPKNNNKYNFKQNSKITNPKSKSFITMQKIRNENENEKQHMNQRTFQTQNQIQNSIPKNQQYDYQESHQEVEYIEEEDHNIIDNDSRNEYDENMNKNEDNNLKKSKYGSYFGDSNNNYYEVKGVSSEKNKEENENEEEEENDENKSYNQNMQLVRNANFGIQSENLCVPAEEDKEEKEADEQIIEEDEQMDDEDNEEEKNKINNEQDYEHEHDYEHEQEMEKIVEENDERNENENIQENDDEGEGEVVGEEIDENGNEEYDENEMVEDEEIEENIIDENNENEEEEINENANNENNVNEEDNNEKGDGNYE